MRAIYLKNIGENNRITVEGDVFHHLANVVRVKEQEELLVLDGVGNLVKSLITKITKKSIEIEFISRTLKERKVDLDLLQAILKKDAMEEVVRVSVQLGIDRIIPYESEYSQRELPSESRISRIIESALIQSNNPYAPIVHKNVNRGELAPLLNSYRRIFLFDLVEKSVSAKPLLNHSKDLLIIGPEGGFSKSEREFFVGFPHVTVIKLQTPILTAPVAVCAAAGYSLALKEFQKS